MGPVDDAFSARSSFPLPDRSWLDVGFDKDMISMNLPPLTQHISIPKDMSSLSCEAFTAGLVEGVMEGLDFVS